MAQAIVIKDWNEDALEKWGESEELTWNNSFEQISERRFSHFLVIDPDTFEQGYATLEIREFKKMYDGPVMPQGIIGWFEVEPKDETLDLGTAKTEVIKTEEISEESVYRITYRVLHSMPNVADWVNDFETKDEAMAAWNLMKSMPLELISLTERKTTVLLRG